MSIDLGELNDFPLRKKWESEPKQFTPWMADNIELLSKALGIELEVESTEVAAGPYSADILARDTGTGKYVVIENQLEKTDHDHLGKSITYASVLDAAYIVWVAADFTEEHKKALDWLNDHTSEDIAFFGVVVELWQIDKSRPAVKFNVISTPNQAVRQAARTKAKEGLSENKKLQLAFWTKFRDELVKTKKLPSVHTPRPQYWFDISLGKTNINLSNTCNTDENKIGLRVYIGNKIADEMLPYLEKHKKEIESKIGDKLIWNPNPDNRDKVIVLYKKIPLTNPEKWDEPIKWLVEKSILFRETFAPIIKDFK